MRWGVAKDFTGAYHAGLIGLAVAYTMAAAIVLLLRRELRARSLAPRNSHLNSRARA